MGKCGNVEMGKCGNREMWECGNEECINETRFSTGLPVNL
jgi:hypothetical protein